MADVRVERISPGDPVACEAVVRLMQDYHFPFESFCRGCGISSSPAAVEQLSLLVRLVLQDGASLGLYCGELLVTAYVNKVQVPDQYDEKPFLERFRDEHAHDPRAAAFMNCMVQVDEMDFFEALGSGRERRVLDVMFGSTLPSHAQRGFGLLLGHESIELARRLGCSALTTIATSDYSAAIARKLGLKVKPLKAKKLHCFAFCLFTYLRPREDNNIE